MTQFFGISFATARVKGSRKNSNNLRDRAAYAAREGQFSERDDLALSGSANLPDWAADPDDFWQAAEANDTGRTATSIRLDMPRNLSRPRQLKALETFIQQQLANRPTSWGWHIDEAADGDDNSHVHILASTRQLDGIDRDRETFFKRYNTQQPERGGAKKAYFAGAHSAARKEQWQGFRTEWAQILNEQLKSEGLPLVDPRSLEAQGIDREPQKKRGYNQSRAAKKAEAEASEAQKTAILATSKAEAAKDLRDRRTKRKAQAADVAPELTATAERTARQTVRKRRRRVRAQKTAENSLSAARTATPGKADPALFAEAQDLARHNLTPKPRTRRPPEERVQKILQKALFTRKTTATIPAHIALNVNGKSPEAERWMRGIYGTGKEPSWISGGAATEFKIDLPALSRAIVQNPARQFAKDTLAAFKRAGLLIAGIVRQRPKTAENSQKNGKQTAAQRAWSSNYKPKKTKDIDLSDL